MLSCLKQAKCICKSSEVLICSLFQVKLTIEKNYAYSNVIQEKAKITREEIFFI